MLTMEDLKRYAEVDSHSFLNDNRDIHNPFPDLISPDNEQTDEPNYCNYCGIYEVDEEELICRACELEFPVIPKKSLPHRGDY